MSNLSVNPVGAEKRADWQISLIVDVALDVDDDSILDAYNLQAHQLDEIKANPMFKVEVARLKKEIERDGSSFKLKARIQAEAMLERSWQMVHNPATPAPVAADLIKATARWAGYDSNGTSSVSGGAGFAIHINLSAGSEKHTGVTIEQSADGDS